MVRIRGFFNEARAALAHFPLSWLRALSADGDGPPNWFWPSCMTGTAIFLVVGGFVYPSRAEYVSKVLVPYCSFVSLTFVAWLGYRGWKWFRAQRESKP